MLTTLSHLPSRMILRQESRTSLLPMTLLANGGKIYWIGCPCIHQSPRLISQLSTPFALAFQNFTWSVTETYVNLPSTLLSWTMLGWHTAKVLKPFGPIRHHSQLGQGRMDRVCGTLFSMITGMGGTGLSLLASVSNPYVRTLASSLTHL